MHSPFLFDFYKYVSSRLDFRDEKLEALRNDLLKEQTVVTRVDFGAQARNGRRTSVANIAKTSLAPLEQNAFLTSTIRYLNAKYILEIGTSLGINALYLAKGSQNGQVLTLEGDPSIANIARAQFKRADVDTIRLLEGEFGQTLPHALSLVPQLDFVFFDGNHRLEPTWAYFQQCLAKRYEESVFVFHDIYWSPEMLRLWKKVVGHHAVTLSLDFFHFGVVFFRTNQPKQHFCLKF